MKRSSPQAESESLKGASSALGVHMSAQPKAGSVEECEEHGGPQPAEHG